MRTIILALALALAVPAGAQNFYAVEVRQHAGGGIDPPETFLINLEHVHAVEPCYGAPDADPPRPDWMCFLLDDNYFPHSAVDLYRTAAPWSEAYPRLMAHLQRPVDPPAGTNTVPTATVEGPTTVVRGESATLMAIVTDPDEGDSWSYQWTLLGGSEGSIAGADTDTIVYTSDPDGTNFTEEIALVVEDFRGGRSVMVVTIAVTEPVS